MTELCAGCKKDTEVYIMETEMYLPLCAVCIDAILEDKAIRPENRDG